MNSFFKFCFCDGDAKNASIARDPALSWHTLKTSTSVMDTKLSENMGTQSALNLNSV